MTGHQREELCDQTSGFENEEPYDKTHLVDESDWVCNDDTSGVYVPPEYSICDTSNTDPPFGVYIPPNYNIRGNPKRDPALGEHLPSNFDISKTSKKDLPKYVLPSTDVTCRYCLNLSTNDHCIAPCQCQGEDRFIHEKCLARECYEKTYVRNYCKKCNEPYTVRTPQLKKSEYGRVKLYQMLWFLARYRVILPGHIVLGSVFVFLICEMIYGNVNNIPEYTMYTFLNVWYIIRLANVNMDSAPYSDIRMTYIVANLIFFASFDVLMNYVFIQSLMFIMMRATWRYVLMMWDAGYMSHIYAIPLEILCCFFVIFFWCALYYLCKITKKHEYRKGCRSKNSPTYYDITDGSVIAEYNIEEFYMDQTFDGDW